MIGAPCQSSSWLTRTRTVSSRQIRQRGSLRSKSVLTGSAAQVIVLIRKWLQPSGFTQNVHCTHRIVSGQVVILQALGIITIHNLTIMLRTHEASGVRGSPARRGSC